METQGLLSLSEHVCSDFELEQNGPSQPSGSCCKASRGNGPLLHPLQLDQGQLWKAGCLPASMEIKLRPQLVLAFFIFRL